jgi:hypothetical protein
MLSVHEITDLLNFFEMNYYQASKLIVDYDHLVNTEFKGKTISALVIAPSNHVGLDRLMYMVNHQLNSPYSYSKYPILDVVVVFDYNQKIKKRELDKISLQEILPYLKTA